MRLPFPMIFLHSGRLASAALLASLTFIAPSPALAQAPLPTPDDFVTPFSAVWITTGKLLVDVRKLNDRFSRPDLATGAVRPGFDALSNDGFIIGGGAYTPIGRVMLGGEFHYSDIGLESSPAGKTNQLTTNYFMATVGYAVWTNWKVSITPYFGVGIGKMTLTLKNRDGGPTIPATASPTFDDVVFSPGQQSRLIGSYYLMQPGIAVDYLVLRDTNSRVGVTLGLRLGTSITPNRTTWQYRGRDVFGAPDAGPVGPSMRLIFGIGGFKMSR